MGTGRAIDVRVNRRDASKPPTKKRMQFKRTVTRVKVATTALKLGLEVLKLDGFSKPSLGTPSGIGGVFLSADFAGLVHSRIGLQGHSQAPSLQFPSGVTYTILESGRYTKA
jgi:hypothetical protein